MDFIGEIFPVDGYYVRLNGSLPIDYAPALTHLYQPLIGIEAISLYQTLLHEMEIQHERSLQTHHTLMNYLNIPLDELYMARLRLEGIGLLKTFKHDMSDKNAYIYELQSPFSPADFFKDVMLTELLIRHLGQEKFTILQKHYVKSADPQKGNNITASFSDVFQTFQPATDQTRPLKQESVEATGVEIETIDFTWMKEVLKRQMIPVQKVLTPENKKIISQMTVLYDLEMYEVEKSILWALTDENELNITDFTDACHDLFKAKHNEIPLKLSQKSITKRKPQFVPKTKEEKLIHTLQTISPKQLLEDFSSGHHASEQDMKIVRDIMVKQGLPAPVMNVLIHYVLLQSNMQLSKAYLEKIASHWSRANLKTAKEAMQFAKEQNKKFQTRNNQQRKANSSEVIPEWFKNRESQQQPKTKVTSQPKTTKELSENEKQDMLTRLKEHAFKSK